MQVCKAHLLSEGRGVIPAIDTQWGEEQDVQRGMWAAAMELDALGVLQTLVQHRWRSEGGVRSVPFGCW